jgi:hypothetical protein
MAILHDKPRMESDWHKPVENNRSEPTENNRSEPMSRQEIRRSAEFVAGGFSGEALAAAGAVVLTILGLAAVFPTYMAPIAAITISTALLMKAGSVAARFSQLSAETGNTPGGEVELGAGMSTELLAGSAGIALGVLALIGIAPTILLPSSVILFGGALLLGGGETYRVSRLPRPEGETRTYREFQTAGKSAAGAETLVGIGAIVLGILALTNAVTITLVLVALLAIASVQLLTGVVESGRMAMLLRS